MIKYLKGDLFSFVKPGVIIPHVVNNKGKMAAGFVVPLCRKYPNNFGFSQENYLTNPIIQV